MKITEQQLKQIIAEEIENVLQEQTEERWEAFLSSVKQRAANLKYTLDDNTAIKLAKYADQKNIAMHQVGDLVKAWIEQHPQKKTAPATKADPSRVAMVNKYATRAGKKLTPHEANKMAIDYDALVKAGKRSQALEELKMKLGVK